MLPTEARDEACRFLVMLSLIRPSPVTFTVKGLPGNKNETFQSVLRLFTDLCLGAGTPTWNVLLSKLDVDVIIARLCGAVGHFACPVFHVFTVDVHFAWTLDGQGQSSVA